MENNEDKPCNNNFMLFAALVILSVSMLSLTGYGLIALISDNECDKNTSAVSEITKPQENSYEKTVTYLCTGTGSDADPLAGCERTNR